MNLVVFVLGVVLVAAPTHAVLLSACAQAGGTADCTELAVDSIVLTVDGGRAVNLTAPGLAINCSSAGTTFVPTSDECGGTPANKTAYTRRQSTLTCTFAANTAASSSRARSSTATSAAADTRVQLSFVFEDSALYHAKTSSAACNAGAVSLANITLLGNVNATSVGGPVAVPAGSMRASINTSFDCPSTTLSFTVNGTNSLSLGGVRAQAFMPNATFAPGDSNAVCGPSSPDTSSTESRAGLVVGGIISALAMLGILAFAYSKCRTKSNYELVNSVH